MKSAFVILAALLIAVGSASLLSGAQARTYAPPYASPNAWSANG